MDGPKGDRANGISNDIMTTSGMCANCSFIAPQKLNALQNQSFIYAAGPIGRSPQSDALDAPLRRHIHYGTFQMDTRMAVNSLMPPLGLKSSTGTQQIGADHMDHERASAAHAFFAVLTFLIMVPIGLFMIRVLEQVKLHLIVQSLALLTVTVAFVLGLVVSPTYQRVRESSHLTSHVANTFQSKGYNSAHQVIGILVWIFFLVQFALGLVSHIAFKKRGQPLNWAIKPHKLGLGALVFALGLVNAALGFNFAVSSWNRLYVPVAIAMLILLTASVFMKKWIAGRWGKKNGAQPQAATYGASQPFSGPTPPYGGGYDTRSDIQLGSMRDDPPSYDSRPTQPRGFA
jgi:hypothetical protein